MAKTTETERTCLLYKRQPDGQPILVSLFSGLIIGRADDADVSIDDAKASRNHVRIVQLKRGYRAYDLGSNNGTFLNEKRIKKAKLRIGDVLRVGQTEFKVIARADLEEKPSGLLPPPRALEPSGGLPQINPFEWEREPTEKVLANLGISVKPDSLGTSADILDKLLEKTRNYAIVLEVAREIGFAQSVSQVLLTAVRSVFRIVSANRCMVALIDSESGELAGGLARQRQDLAEVPISFSRTIVDQVIRTKTPLLSPDVLEDELLQTKASVLSLRLGSVLCVPIVIGDAVLGILQLDYDCPTDELGENELELMTILGAMLGVQLKNARLFDEQKATIEELRKIRSQLLQKERMAMLGTFAAGIAHEVRNLMTPLALAGLLQQDYRDDEQLCEFLEMAAESYQQTVSLVAEIGHMARGQQQALALTEGDLESTIRGVLRFVQMDPGVKKHKVTVEAKPITSFLYDAGRLKLVLINLIRNAAQAMETNGELVVRVAPDKKEDQMARIDVIDNGKGISVGTLENIWEPFFTTKAGDSAGIGLGICKNIVERHRGRLECESQEGIGTTMSVFLPMRSR